MLVWGRVQRAFFADYQGYDKSPCGHAKLRASECSDNDNTPQRSYTSKSDPKHRGICHPTIPQVWVDVWDRPLYIVALDRYERRQSLNLKLRAECWPSHLQDWDTRPGYFPWWFTFHETHSLPRRSCQLSNPKSQSVPKFPVEPAIAVGFSWPIRFGPVRFGPARCGSSTHCRIAGARVEGLAKEMIFLGIRCTSNWVKVGVTSNWINPHLCIAVFTRDDVSMSPELILWLTGAPFTRGHRFGECPVNLGSGT